MTIVHLARWWIPSGERIFPRNDPSCGDFEAGAMAATPAAPWGFVRRLVY